MYSGIKYFPYFLKSSIGHFMNCFKCSSTSSVRFYSQTKQQVFLFTACFRNVYIVPYSQGTIQPWRLFSCKDLLKSEQKNWRVCSANYTDLRERMKQKLEKHYNSHSSSPSSLMIKFGDYIYFEENGCIFRSKLGEVGEQNYEALLSTEALPFEDSFIQQIRISPDHGYMATGIKSANSEECACIIVKLQPLSKVECIIPHAFSFEWATHEILFYTTQKNLQCHDVYLSDFNKKHSELVYTETDARYFVDLYRTKDKHFITINSNSKTTSEVWLIDCHHPFKSPVLVQKRTKNVIYHVEHRNNELYILTTYGNPVGYKLMKAPVGSCGLENWQPIYIVKENTKLIDLEMFRDHCITFLKLGGELYLDIISLVSNTVENVKLPDWACSLELEPNSEYTANTCYFWLMSPLQSPVRFAYSLMEKSLTEFTEQEVPITVNCKTVRLEAKSKDETWVPITVFYKSNSTQLHRMPLLVHVYGAYGIDLNMTFKAENLMLIKDGWILAFCHVRGGGELGLRWHKDGCMMKKHNGIQDLQACIKLLHELGYSQPIQTALISMSAGGVLAGALCNIEPHLIRAVVLQAPFLDILNTMLDPHLPLTIEEQEEWGDPVVDEACKEYIKSYCPYQNIKPQNYPSLFITVSEKDQRVPLAGLLRYINKLRKAVQDHAETNSSDDKGAQIPNIILDVQPGGSHCSPTCEDSLKQVATQLAFLYSELGLDKQE
ncbi:prolyl endopeptidase-like [Python bivittatus]|uniref:Prolyl endopeptidase n=1 Tax=Python bivittatus TaxID=176946 RepID=A0A9F5ISV5_PYTBI|nr:prolyl endopeptidase-like [Python bivittatus]XP_025020155.1 prolyl endopeptidase-like [Python bivittatus]XP_025020156.1 prolyl endopeptidase-like [Python bivittatus]XP_025020158.1 prolyl endopeptidase-like [Python bivittatus]XP_025020159.1 prolyl endopeptidase-like [Python bivittatus]